MICRRNISGRAFTLVEVMLSLVILAILASSIGWLVREMREKNFALRRLSDDLTVTTSVFEVMDGAVLNAVALDPLSGGAGVRGSENLLEVVSRGAAADLDGSGDELSGLMRTRLEFDPEGMTLSIGRSGGASPPTMQVVSRRVERLRVRFHDGSGWGSDFDSAAFGGLPVAVEVGVWFVSALDERAAAPGAEGGREGAGSAFEGFGAPMRDDIEAAVSEAVRAPDRYRIFSVLDAAAGLDGATAGGLLP